MSVPQEVAIKDADHTMDRLAGELARLRGRVVELEALNSRREQAERRSKLQSRLLDAVGQAVIVTDLQGAITYWNRFAEELYGWSEPEVLGRSIVDVTPSEVFRERADEIMAELKEGKSWSGEFLVRRKNGTSFPAMVTNTPVYDEAGTLVGIIGVSMDVTERRRAEEAMEKQNVLLETILKQAADAVIVCDARGKLTFVNAAARRLALLDPEETALDIAPEVWGEAYDPAGGYRLRSGLSPGLCGAKLRYLPKPAWYVPTVASTIS